MKPKIKRIGILTGGGDCPGLNAVIRGVTKPAHDYGISVIGILDGFEGLVERKSIELYNKDVNLMLTVCIFSDSFKRTYILFICVWD